MLQIFSKAKENRTALSVSLANMLVLSLLVYILNNQSIFTGENLNHYAWMEIIKKKIGLSNEYEKKDALFVNVAYDKQLIDVNDEYGTYVGNIDITDRTKLLTFIRLLHATNKYKYIFLDVTFEKGYEVPEVDSLLFSEIGSMRDIVVASHSDIEMTPNSMLRKKAAISDFKSTIVATNFMKYKYSYGDRMSMPLYAYHELTGKSIKRCGIFYTSDGHLCYNSLFLKFPVGEFEEFDEEGNKNYYNLGSELLKENNIAELTKDKYVVIGDMTEDMHDTYAGSKPGSVITYNAFQTLMKGEHFVKWWLVMMMAVVYFAISWWQFNYEIIFEKIPYVRKSKSKTLHFVLSLVEYTALLFLIVTVIDFFWNLSMSIFLPSIYFAIQKNIINYKRTNIQ